MRTFFRHIKTNNKTKKIIKIKKLTQRKRDKVKTKHCHHA